MDKEQYYKENGITSVREHWISVDKCPQCGSKSTFHSEWMNDKELQEKSTINVWRMYTSNTRSNDNVTDPYEKTFTKEDLCLECGHNWVMYVEVIKVDPSQQLI